MSQPNPLSCDKINDDDYAIVMKHPFSLPQLPLAVWILALGRFLSQVGNGFVLFYAPIFFVNQVGLSATAVGVGLGSSSVSGVIGRFLGGSLADLPRWGRRQTLLLSALVSALADVVFVLADNFPIFLLGNLLMGLGVGLYWPPTEAAVADLTTGNERTEAFAITRLADSAGISLGVVIGGAFIAWGGNPRILFIADGISFLVFFGLVYVAIAETRKFLAGDHTRRLQEGWKVALSDRRLMVFVAVNILFTSYLAQIQSTLPLYLTNFTPNGGFKASTISILFTWHVVCAALLQLPIARWLSRFTHPQALGLSISLWGLGFIVMWMTGVLSTGTLFWAVLALTVLSLATVTYMPSASALVADLSPDSLRGIYLSINSQCWAIGYLIGPPLGGWALDQSKAIATSYWLVTAASTFLGFWILRALNRRLRQAC